MTDADDAQRVAAGIVEAQKQHMRDFHGLTEDTDPIYWCDGSTLTTAIAAALRAVEQDASGAITVAHRERDDARHALVGAREALRAARAEEREACAVVVENVNGIPMTERDQWICAFAATVIRARDDDTPAWTNPMGGEPMVSEGRTRPR